MWTTPTISGFASPDAEAGNFCYQGSGWFNNCTSGTGRFLGLNTCSNGTSWWDATD